MGETEKEIYFLHAENQQDQKQEKTMNILIITDIEGSNHIMDFDGYCHPTGRYYDKGCQLLTEELNAVIQGFFEADPSVSILVWDGHGEGAVDVGSLDERVSLQAGAPNWPDFGGNFDCLAFVGQHAKAGAVNGHLAHTQTGDAIDFRINGVSLGEFGQQLYAMTERNCCTIFASGDLALTREAKELLPEIYTVAVKEGIFGTLPENVTTDQLLKAERPAIHYPRNEVLAALKKTAFEALCAYKKTPEKFVFTLPEGPYVAQGEYRRIGSRLKEIFGDLPARNICTGEHKSVIEAIRKFYQLEWQKPDGVYSVEVRD